MSGQRPTYGDEPQPVDIADVDIAALVAAMSGTAAAEVTWHKFKAAVSGNLAPAVEGKRLKAKHLFVQKQIDNATVVTVTLNDSETNALIEDAPEFFLKDPVDGAFLYSPDGLFVTSEGQGIDVVLSAGVTVLVQVGVVEV